MTGSGYGWGYQKLGEKSRQVLEEIIEQSTNTLDHAKIMEYEINCSKNQIAGKCMQRTNRGHPVV